MDLNLKESNGTAGGQEYFISASSQTGEKRLTFLICQQLATAMRTRIRSEHEQANETQHDQGGQHSEDDFFVFGDGKGHG